MQAMTFNALPQRTRLSTSMPKTRLSRWLAHRRIACEEACLRAAAARAVHDGIEGNTCMAGLRLDLRRTGHVSEAAEPVFGGPDGHEVRAVPFARHALAERVERPLVLDRLQ